MKKIILLLMLTPFIIACDKKPMEDPARTVINPEAVEPEESLGIVEENDSCICTKEYMPVCADGMTYPSACQAGCDGKTEFTDGSCEED